MSHEWKSERRNLAIRSDQANSKSAHIGLSQQHDWLLYVTQFTNLIAKFQGCGCSICLRPFDKCVTICVGTSVGGRSFFERIKSVSRVAASARFTMAISRHIIAKWQENS